ncbi:MAG TPA: hypothetical protein VI479_18305, partial [Blastocatellia bacterium]
MPDPQGRIREITGAAEVEESRQRVASRNPAPGHWGDMGYVFANDWAPASAADDRCLEEGRELYRVFHNSAERRIIRRRCDRTIPRVLVDLGALRGLIYSADRDGCGKVKTFIHFMETPPRLMCDPQGNQ